MSQRLLIYVSHSKYRLMMFGLLTGATVFSVTIWRVRAEFSGSERYARLV